MTLTNENQDGVLFFPLSNMSTILLYTEHNPWNMLTEAKNTKITSVLVLLNFPVNSLGQENDVIVYPNCNTKNGVAHLAM